VWLQWVRSNDFGEGPSLTDRSWSLDAPQGIAHGREGSLVAASYDPAVRFKVGLELRSFSGTCWAGSWLKACC
jgi:hypothetical protein